MSQFNQAKSPQKATATTISGSQAYPQKDIHLELFGMVSTNMLGDKYYESADSGMKRLVDLIKTADPEFVLKLAIYTRQELHMRSVPVVLVITLMKHLYSQRTAVSKERKQQILTAIFGIVERVDDITECLAYYKHINNLTHLHKVSKVLQYGLAACFHKFDEYQFGKYKGQNKDISLRDAMFICRPKPVSSAQEALFEKIANNELETPETHETVLSAAGGDADVAADAWAGLIRNKKLGYMATLRNLNNIGRHVQSQADIDLVCQYLKNPQAVENSKQLPFRFYTAYKNLNVADYTTKRKFADAIYVAAIHSLRNMTLLDQNESVLAVADISDSMSNKTSEKSTVTCAEIAMFYSSMMSRMNSNCQLGFFGTHAKLVDSLSIHPFECLETRSQHARTLGHGTNPADIFAKLGTRKVDKIFIFSDLQFWSSNSLHSQLLGNRDQTAFQSALNGYRNNINPNLKVILIDLRGYGGGLPVKTNDKTIVISGWSDKTFQFDNSEQILEEINGVQL